MTRANKMPVAALVIALSGIAAYEGYTSYATQPVPGDPWTIGHGTTVYADGTPVKQGDVITPKRALEELQYHAEEKAKEFERSIPDVPLSQDEYDVYLDFVYNFGITNWRKSSMRRYLLAGEYVEACESLLMWRNVRGADCSKPENWYGRGQDCRGVWLRQQERHFKCMAANE